MHGKGMITRIRIERQTVYRLAYQGTAPASEMERTWNEWQKACDLEEKIERKGDRNEERLLASK